MGILLIGVLLVYGTLNLNEIVTPVVPVPWYFSGLAAAAGVPDLLHRHAG